MSTTARPGFDIRDQEVDTTLIDELLALTPDERLRWNQRMVETIMELRAAFEQREKAPPRDGHKA